MKNLDYLKPMIPLHLTTLSNNDLLHRPIRLPIRPSILNHLDNLHALEHLPKNNMFAIQMRRRRTRDEELTAVGIRPAVGHGQQTRRVVLEREVLVGEGLRAVDRGAACAVAVYEIAGLEHEALDLCVLGYARLA